MGTGNQSDVLGQFYVRGSDDLSWPGVLAFGRHASLRLLILAAGTGDELPAPLASALDGKQIDIIGESNARGCITLLRCANTNRRTSHHGFGGAQTTELAFQPTAIWTGPRPFVQDDNYSGLVMGFSGIHSIVGTKPLGHKLLADGDEKAIITNVLGDTYEVFYRDVSAKYHVVKLADPPVEVAFGSGYSTSFSWNEGDAISTYDECVIEADTEQSGEILISSGSKIEQFLSFICLKTIRCNRFLLERSQGPNLPLEKYERVWYFGERDGSAAVMYHEALGTYSREASAMEAALKSWLSPSGDEALARWLYPHESPHFRGDSYWPNFIANDRVGQSRLSEARP